MVCAMVLTGIFNRNHVSNILYHTNGFFGPGGVGADRTDRAITDIETVFTKLNLLAHSNQCLTKLVGAGGILFQQM